MADRQISAHISDSTRAMLEEYVQAHGVKKGRLIEEALLHHFQALRELPADLIVPARLVVPEASYDRIARLVKRPRRPTPALRKLMERRPPTGRTKAR